MEYLGHQTHPNAESNTRQTIEASPNQDLTQQTKVAKPDLFYSDRKKLQMEEAGSTPGPLRCGRLDDNPLQKPHYHQKPGSVPSLSFRHTKG